MALAPTMYGEGLLEFTGAVVAFVVVTVVMGDFIIIIIFGTVKPAELVANKSEVVG